MALILRISLTPKSNNKRKQTKSSIKEEKLPIYTLKEDPTNNDIPVKSNKKSKPP
jgi:hypothetical protein